MKEQHHFIATWDSDNGWFINIEMMELSLVGGNVHVFADATTSDEEAEEMINKWTEADIGTLLQLRTDRLMDQLDESLENMNYRPVTLEDLGGG